MGGDRKTHGLTGVYAMPLLSILNDLAYIRLRIFPDSLSGNLPDVAIEFSG
jgi:hypothetical protein